jgi:HK97 gp10 family phage protein
MISWDMSEVRALADDLGDAGPRVVERSRLVVEKTGYDTVADAQTLCPVRTGHLKSTIDADYDADGLGFEAGATASYAHFVEFGTSRMSPQPYLMPAFDRRVPPAFQALEQVAGDIL